MIDSNKRRLPGPRTARGELADMEAVQALGLNMNLEEARVCAVVWSWFLADGRAKTRSPLYQAMYCLGFAAGIAVYRDGVAESAPHPELSGVAWPQADAGFRQLGIDHLDLAAYWRLARHEADDACYPLEWLTTFFPPAIWPMLLRVIRWGPERSAVQFEQTAIVMGQTPIQYGTRRRPEGSLTARSSVDARIGAVWRLMRMVVDVRARVKSSPRPTLALELLEPWAHQPQRPDLIDCGTVPSGMDNSGPSLAECRERLHELVGDYEQNPDFPYTRLRRVVLLALFLLCGPRADALRTTWSTDYNPTRLWPDGERRPTLTIRPGKTWEYHEEHYLPLPTELAGWLERWISLNVAKYGEDPLPLFPGQRQEGEPLAPLSDSAFYCAVAGRPRDHVTGQHSLVPLNGDPYTGMRPHGLRKTSSELAHQAAVALKTKHPGVYDHLTPEHFSRALLGHRLVQSVADVYRSLDPQRLTSLVVEEAWQILWHDGPEPEPSSAAPSETIPMQLAAVGLELLRLQPECSTHELASTLAEQARVLSQLAERASQ